MTPLRKQMIEELQLRNLSEATIHTYVDAVERYAKHFNTSPAKLGPERVREYLLYLLNDHHVSSSTLQVKLPAVSPQHVAVPLLYACRPTTGRSHHSTRLQKRW